MPGVGGGSLYYGKYGFLYKQKPAGGGRKSTKFGAGGGATTNGCLLYTSPSPRDISGSRMPSSA